MLIDRNYSSQIKLSW